MCGMRSWNLGSWENRIVQKPDRVETGSSETGIAWKADHDDAGSGRPLSGEVPGT
jgi:hypothetical protein